MRHRRRKTALLTAAAAAVLALQGPFAALAASPQFAYDADTWAKLQDNVMEYSELPYLVQEYNPTYLNNQTTYQAGRDTKNAKEVQDKQYNQANDLYDSADNLRDQADQIEDFLAVPGMASAYASLMSASVMVEQNALKTQQSALIQRNPCQSQRTRRQKCVIQAIRQADLVRRHSHRDTEPDWEDGKLHCKEKQQHQRQPEGRRSRDHDAIARNQAIHPLAPFCRRCNS